MHFLYIFSFHLHNGLDDKKPHLSSFFCSIKKFLLINSQKTYEKDKLCFLFADKFLIRIWLSILDNNHIYHNTKPYLNASQLYNNLII